MRLFYWLRVHWKRLLRRFCCIDSFCKVCGRTVHDFHVDSATWAKVESLIPAGKVVCYDCFCELCGEAGLATVWRLESIDK